MKEYVFKRVSRITESVKVPWYLWILFFSSHIAIIQEGIVLINEKGNKRIIWESMEKK